MVIISTCHMHTASRYDDKMVNLPPVRKWRNINKSKAHEMVGRLQSRPLHCSCRMQHWNESFRAQQLHAIWNKKTGFTTENSLLFRLQKDKALNWKLVSKEWPLLSSSSYHLREQSPQNLFQGIPCAANIHYLSIYTSIINLPSSQNYRQLNNQI